MLELFQHPFFHPFGSGGAAPLAEPVLDWRVYLLLAGAILVAATIHEWGHACTADLLGDKLPRKEGRLRLNPFVHFDPLGGLLMLATLLLNLPVGWGKAVRTNPDNYRCGKRLGTALVALGGPAANLLLAVLLSSVVRLILDGAFGRGPLAAWLFLGLCIAVLINLSLFVFNLVPVPPLDGAHVVASLLPPRLGTVFRDVMKQVGPVILLGLVASGWMAETLAPFVLKLFRLLIGI